MKARTWYRIANAASDPTVVDIHVIDIIGDWMDDLINEYYGFKATLTAKAFVDQLSKLDAGVKAIRVHINSPGGDVFAALNIANALREQQTSKGRTVETIIDGLAASAASIIAMAGTTVRMADNALLMVHNPWTMAVGNAATLRTSADQLDTVRDTIVATYQWHSPLAVDELRALMDAETWMPADQALEKGFVTAVEQGLAAAASIDPRAIAALTIPEQYRARVAAFVATPPPAPPARVAAAAADIIAACQAAQLGLELAGELVSAGVTAPELEARIADATRARDAAAARATEVRTICATAGLTELAADYVAGGMPVDGIRRHVVALRARLQSAEIDGTLSPKETQTTGGVVINAQNIYAERNRPRLLKESTT
jgi:ATP-dependent protease ClpP protease subunit